ncbi:uncharacterized protein LMH87_007561 [Akanthomyces muscarius]|uniref:Uncharacterized protein n=1 Tax=Akanthomyces muscarius TaxID=2231603 RepID=A0A9W8QME5_AKAMU|nr:uncharacterized protein LMH87_007561 [Akanthomyces muscarius]KAJ4161525.1 hypothetical protein LMH87_007561 [Akanthomyces muscarius]
MSADILFEADRCLEAMRELRKVEGGTLLDLRNARLADWEHTSKSEVNARTTMWTVPLLPPWERLQAMDDAIAELGQTLGPHQPHNADMTRLLLLRIAQEPESPYRERKYKEILSVFGDRDCKLAMDTKVECYMQLCNIYLSRSDGEGAYVCVEKLNEIATTPFAKTIAFHQQAGVYLHHQKRKILVTIHELLHRFKDDGGEDAKQSLENMKQFLTRLLNNDQT